jgi:hypothetical protein
VLEALFIRPGLISKAGYVVDTISCKVRMILLPPISPHLGSDWPTQQAIGDVAGSGLVARLGRRFFRWR